MFIIAEASKNWLIRENLPTSEALSNAKRLARVAKGAGADCVKFQCHVSEDELPKRHPKRHSWIKLNEALTPLRGFWEPLANYCHEIQIEFLITPMSVLAAEKVSHLIKRWKVASPDILDHDLLAYLKDTGKEIILSSGMTQKSEQSLATEFLGDNYKILHCVSEYPCPLEHLNLKELRFYDGLSDHTTSVVTGALAVVLGAQIIEKHFTISDWGKDAAFSLSPGRLKQYVDHIREAELVLQTIERPTQQEKELLKDFWQVHL